MRATAEVHITQHSRSSDAAVPHPRDGDVVNAVEDTRTVLPGSWLTARVGVLLKGARQEEVELSQERVHRRCRHILPLGLKGADVLAGDLAETSVGIHAGHKANTLGQQRVDDAGSLLPPAFDHLDRVAGRGGIEDEDTHIQLACAKASQQPPLIQMQRGQTSGPLTDTAVYPELGAGMPCQRARGPAAVLADGAGAAGRPGLLQPNDRGTTGLELCGQVHAPT